MEEKFKFFWRSPLSQWTKVDMYDPLTGLTFNCCEQYMMYGKARLFGDTDAMKDIMDTDSPREQQAIGRRVRGFDQKIWDLHARSIVCHGNYLKFTQNPEHLSDLLHYADYTFVEASPYDCVWGIGFSEDSPQAKSRDTWRGKNWLGECLTKVKDKIIWDHEVWDLGTSTL